MATHWSLFKALVVKIYAEIYFFSLHSYIDDILQLVNQYLGVLLLVHPLDDPFPDQLFQLSILGQSSIGALLQFGDQITYKLFRFERIFFSKYLFEGWYQCALHVVLHESKLFVALVFQDFLKEANFMIFARICQQSIDNGLGPLQN